MKKEALRVSTTVPSAPTTLYFAWLSSEQHSAMTGAAAKIDPTVGASYTAGGGYIQGKLVVLDLGRRIIMSWRTTDFPRDAVDSRVEIHLEALGGSTRFTILHTDIPEGQGETYRQFWNEKYFAPMRTYFSKYLPDPREPPPPRKPPPVFESDDDDEEDEQEEQALRPAPKKPGKAKPSATPPAASSRKLVAAAPSKSALAKPSGKPSTPAPTAKKAAAKPSTPAPKPAAPKPAAAKPAAKPATPSKAVKPTKPAKAVKPTKPAKPAAKPAKPAKKPAAKAPKKAVAKKKKR